MDRFIVGFIGVPLGFLIMIYRMKIREVTGPIDFAEDKLGPGGTYTLYVLIGLAVSIISVMYAFGTFQELFAASLGQFFR